MVSCVHYDEALEEWEVLIGKVTLIVLVSSGSVSLVLKALFIWAGVLLGPFTRPPLWECSCGLMFPKDIVPIGKYSYR